MTTDSCTSNGELEEVIEKLEDARDSLEEALEELEEIEERHRFYRADSSYDLAMDSEYNGEERE